MKRAIWAVAVACAVGGGATPSLAQSSATRSSSFAYDAASGLLNQEVIEPNRPDLMLETDTTYDAFGNKVSVTVSGSGVTSRTMQTVYDAQGQFQTSTTNGLGQSESYQSESSFGKPISHTGPNNLTTTWSYDTFGRKILEVRPDHTQTKWTYLFCNGVNGGVVGCIAGGSYLVIATPYAADGSTVNGPSVTVYYDLLDREIGRDSQGFDGSSVVRATRQYDSLGRVSNTSRPFFASSGTAQLTTFTYDVLSRVLTETRPDGEVYTTAYHGLTVTATNALNQTRSVTRSSQGKVVSVTDALGQTMLFAYDAEDNLIQTTDAVGNIVTAAYDLRGRKTSSSDPDLGSWTYAYNVYGELTSQTDAKGQITNLTYDILGRMVQRAEADMTSVWVYDTAAYGIGKLASSSITQGSGTGYARSFRYDGYGRPSQVFTTIDGANYVFGASYDSNGRLNKVNYPSGFTARYSYTSLGYASLLQDDASNFLYWAAATMDAEGHLTEEGAGNGVTTWRMFNPTNGRMTGVQTDHTVQNFSYTYDKLGNPLSRSDANTNLSESLVYDALNRLTSATVSLTPTSLVKSFSYSPIGNMLSKSDVGNYNYAAPGSPLPHAVMSTIGGTISTTFTYDPNGNQTAGLGRTMTWTSYNKPSSITAGTRTINFLDDTDHQRFKQITPEGTTLYIAAFGMLAEVNNPGNSSALWTDYLSVGSARVGMRTLQVASLTLSTRYFYTDNLGSISVITDENGVVVERLSYDAWGKRRNPDGTDDTTGSITSQTTRGFTGEEELSVAGLVHLNGRVYDPLLARMTSADPTVTDPTNPQGWNRYSYVGNDPLAFTDPNGYSWLASFFRNFSNTLRATPILRVAVQIVATLVLTAVLPPAGAGLSWLGAAYNATAAAGGAVITTGLSGGNLGQAFKAGAIAAAQSLAFYGAGEFTNQFPAANIGPNGEHGIPTFGSEAYGVNVASHAAIGCASAMVSGGPCGAGALSAGAGAAAGPALANQGFAVRLTATATIGGVASVAGGGKFANGALTAAFGYLFNACGADPQGCMKWGASVGAAAGLAASVVCDGATVMVCSVGNPAIVAGGTALGMSAGAAFDSAADAVGNYVHGNSMDSQRLTYVYQLTGPNNEVLKYGITSEQVPQDRYSAAEYAAMDARMGVLGSYSSRWMARAEEMRLNGNYVIQNGQFPPRAFRW